MPQIVLLLKSKPVVLIEMEFGAKPFGEFWRNVSTFIEQAASHNSTHSEHARKSGTRKSVVREQVLAQNFAWMEGGAIAAFLGGLIGLPDGGISYHCWYKFCTV